MEVRIRNGSQLLATDTEQMCTKREIHTKT